MNAVTVHTVVGDDGVLRIDIPLGNHAAKMEVRLTINLISKPRFTREE
jgi:hypothetical protein